MSHQFRAQFINQVSEFFFRQCLAGFFIGSEVDLILVAALGLFVVTDVNVDTVLSIANIKSLLRTLDSALVQILQTQNLAHQGRSNTHDTNRSPRFRILVLEAGLLLFSRQLDLTRCILLQRTNDNVDQVCNRSLSLDRAVRTLHALLRFFRHRIERYTQLRNLNFALGLTCENVNPVGLHCDNVVRQNANLNPLTVRQLQNIDEVFQSGGISTSLRLGVTKFHQ